MAHQSVCGISDPESVTEHFELNGNYRRVSSPASRQAYYYLPYPSRSLSQLQDVSLITFILQLREGKSREVKYLLQSHTGFDLNLSGFKAFMPSVAQEKQSCVLSSDQNRLSRLLGFDC